MGQAGHLYFLDQKLYIPYGLMASLPVDFPILLSDHGLPRK